MNVMHSEKKKTENISVIVYSVSSFMIQKYKVTAKASSNATNYKLTVIIVKLSSLFIF